MRKLIALAIAFFFVLQATVALAAPVEGCCMEDCKATACGVTACTACIAHAAVNSRSAEFAFQPEASLRSGDEAVLPNAAQEVWRPPD